MYQSGGRAAQSKLRCAPLRFLNTESNLLTFLHSSYAALIETADFSIDLAAKRVRRHGRERSVLTATEWQVVELLARNPGRLITQRQLLEQVWGLRNTKTNYVRVFLVTIRRKLEPDPAHPRYFVTEPGSGIRFVPEGVLARAAGGEE